MLFVSLASDRLQASVRFGKRSGTASRSGAMTTTGTSLSCMPAIAAGASSNASVRVANKYMSSHHLNTPAMAATNLPVARPLLRGAVLLVEVRRVWTAGLSPF
jgi:hypothetical protein